jgi:hypothetical protein
MSTTIPQPPGYEAAVAAVRANIDDLSLYLAVWLSRADACLEPHARRCASDAVNAIDVIITELHGIRGHLIPEMAAADREALAHADGVLRLLREEPGQ